MGTVSLGLRKQCSAAAVSCSKGVQQHGQRGRRRSHQRGDDVHMTHLLCPPPQLNTFFAYHTALHCRLAMLGFLNGALHELVYGEPLLQQAQDMAVWSVALLAVWVWASAGETASIAWHGGL